MDPRYLTYVVLQIYFFVVVGIEDPRMKGCYNRGMAYACQKLPTFAEVTRPCVGRDPVRFSRRLSRGVPMWQ